MSTPEMAPAKTTALLTTSQAADHLGISAAELTSLRRTGKGPEWGQFEATIRYTTSELDTWRKRVRRPPVDTPSESPNRLPTPPDGYNDCIRLAGVDISNLT